MVSFCVDSIRPDDPQEDNIYLIDPQAYIFHLRRRWAGVVIDNVQSVYCLRWELPSGFEGRLFADGKGITISANPRDDAIEFALWHRSIVPQEYPLFLFDDGLSAILELRADTTRAQIYELFG